MINDFPQTLTIAGSDSGGGAGMEADLKTMQMRHVFGTTVLVAITAQNTLGVQKAVPLSPEIINAQFKSIADDFHIRACKTGMLADSKRVQTVVNNLKKYDFGPLVVDPVMVAKGGAPLLTEDAVKTVVDELLPLADLVTPNLPEAEKLAGMKIASEDAMVTAAKKIQQLGPKNVLTKGGHLLADDQASDFTILENGDHFWMSSPRMHTKRTHGTGDTISSCIVAELAKGRTLEEAIHIAKQYVTATIIHTIQVGHGHGPLNHWAAEGGF